MKFNPRTLMIASLAVSAVLVTSSAAVVVSNYASTQASAQGQLASTLASTQEQIRLTSSRIADLELAISNTEAVLADSSGKVLDDTSRIALEKALASAQKTLVKQQSALRSLQTAAKQLASIDAQDLLWPYGLSLQADQVIAEDQTDIPSIARSVIALGEGIQGVQAAQTAWQAEQDRIAAEQAAAEAAAAAQAAAAARRAAQAQTIQEAGGETTPTTPERPADETPVVANFDAAAYIRALAPNANVIWRPGVCEEVLGYQVYLCGFAVINLNGVNTDPVNIYLDSSLTDRYSNNTGLTVLVHEAAHARQFWTYGPAMLPDPTTAPLYLGGRFPAEFMADCATIAKLGRATGAYSGAAGFPSCNAEQIAEAATIW